MRIAVVGLGKIGLPLAVQYARKGHSVSGVDIDLASVEAINAGASPFHGEAFLDEYLKQVVTQGLLEATTDGAAGISRADVIVVAVPLALDSNGQPDFSMMVAAANTIGQSLQPGALVSFETTLPIGATRNRMTPILEARSGMKVVRDFNVVYSPERVFTGRVFEDLKRYPKLVGGLSFECEKRGVAFYEQVLDFDARTDLTRPNGVWAMGSAESAEMAKLVETTYRDVNIALANQFAAFAERQHIDIYRVIEACNSQPFSHVHQPGASVGGHCIPVYPRLYLSCDPNATVIREARLVNEAGPERVARRIENRLGGVRGLTVAVLGVAYRPGVKEAAFSGAFPLVDAFRRMGATVRVHDGWFSDDELRAMGLVPLSSGDRVDVAILHTAHHEYASWGPADLPGVRLIFDGRNALAAEDWPEVDFLRLGAAE